MTPKSYELIIGKGVKSTIDKHSRTRVVSFPFEFPDETRGVIIICKVKNKDWTPSDDITSLELKFK